MKPLFLFLCIILFFHAQAKSQASDSEVKKLIKAGNLQEIEKMIGSGLDINTRFKRKSTLLHYAVTYGNYTIVNFLIAKGANLNLQDKDRNTPLMLSTQATTQNDSIAELLISNGANPNIVGLSGSTALRNTVGIFNYGQNPKIFKLLVEKGADYNSPCTTCCNRNVFLYCCSWGTTEMLQLLIDKKANPDAADCKGLNGLMYAIKIKNKENIQLLLQTKINLDHKDKKGKNILDYATASNDSEILNLVKSKNMR